MKAGDRIRSRRVELGLRDVDVAERVGLSIYEYGDLEQHADEFATAIALKDAQRLCGMLGLSLLDVLEIPGTAVSSSVSPQQLIRDAREREGLTVAELADHIGFTDETVQSIEEK